jgi:hypothetical protein
MATRRAAFTQSDLTKVLKAYRDAGMSPPQIVIEPQRITVTPMSDAARHTDSNPWDAQ